MAEAKKLDRGGCVHRYRDRYRYRYRHRDVDVEADVNTDMDKIHIQKEMIFTIHGTYNNIGR